MIYLFDHIHINYYIYIQFWKDGLNLTRWLSPVFNLTTVVMCRLSVNGNLENYGSWRNLFWIEKCHLPLFRHNFCQAASCRLISWFLKYGKKSWQSTFIFTGIFNYLPTFANLSASLFPLIPACPGIDCIVFYKRIYNMSVKIVTYYLTCNDRAEVCEGQRLMNI